MFLGVSTLNLDAKGRMAIPAKHRDALTGESVSPVVVTAHPDVRCLMLYPEAEFKEMARKLLQMPNKKRDVARVQRLLLGYASEVELDAQGRILLSNELRGFANLSKKVSLVGQGRKFEIWDEAVWQQNCDTWIAEGEDADSELSDELSELVF